MRHLILFFAMVFSFIGCNTDKLESVSLENDLLHFSEQRNPTQKFAIPPNQDTVIIGDQDTKLFFKANSFEFDNGEEPQGEITITMKEVYSYSEMVLNGLSTTANGNLLETSGMIYVTASSEGRDLSLKSDYPVRIQFKRLSEFPKMRTFQGELNSNGINWKLDSDNVYDTLKFINRTETIIEKPFGGDSIISVQQSFGVVGLDTLLLSETISAYGGYFGDYDTTSVSSQPYPREPYYEIYSTQLDWINCDYFIDSADNLEIYTNNLDSLSNNPTFLIFQDYNAIMRNWDMGDDPQIFSNIPPDSEVIIISMAKRSDVYFLALSYNTLVKNRENIKLDYKKRSLEDIKKIISSLDESS